MLHPQYILPVWTEQYVSRNLVCDQKQLFIRHRKCCQLLSYLWYCVMASRGEQVCIKALNSPKNMSLGVCAECWPALAELQAWKLHAALLTYTHSYSEISRNAGADAMGTSALLTRAEPPEISVWHSQLAKEMQVISPDIRCPCCSSISVVFKGRTGAERKFKQLW